MKTPDFKNENEIAAFMEEHDGFELLDKGLAEIIETPTFKRKQENNSTVGTREKTLTSKLLNSQLLIYHDFGEPIPKVESLGSNRIVKGEFAEKLLLYDRVIIPTFDFSVMPVLMMWLGNDTLEELLEQDAISFIRHQGFIGYSGGGVGLSVFLIHKDTSVSARQSWVAAAFGDTESALDAWIHNASVKPELKQRQRIIDKVLSRTTTVVFEEGEFERIIADETYGDVSDSFLSRHFTPGIHPNDLPGIEQNTVRVMNLYQPQQNDEVEFVLRLAAINFETYLAYVAEEADLTSSFDISGILAAKVERLLKKTQSQVKVAGLSKGFSKILELNRIPDIVSAVAKGELTFSEVSKIRVRKKAVNFRNWFHANIADNPKEADKEYVAAIEKPGLTNRLPIKSLRFLVTFGLGFIQPIIATVASIMDSFVLDKLISGYSPKFFIDELRARLPGK